MMDILWYDLIYMTYIICQKGSWSYSILIDKMRLTRKKIFPTFLFFKVILKERKQEHGSYIIIYLRRKCV